MSLEFFASHYAASELFGTFCTIIGVTGPPDTNMLTKIGRLHGRASCIYNQVK